jgi:hypothetical protein
LRYSQIIGSLMYLASATRPDISYAVSKLSWFVSNPDEDHWQALVMGTWVPDLPSSEI